MSERSLEPESYTTEEVETFRREFQTAILKAFLDDPPEPGSLMPWEMDEPEPK